MKYFVFWENLFLCERNLSIYNNRNIHLRMFFFTPYFYFELYSGDKLYISSESVKHDKFYVSLKNSTMN